ncbi:MAG: hypothetical protein JJT94_01085 [Bernardetiaceae bacterium]|nr:hypothetical protein [Bernardetiaceae bacterium]
MFEILRYFFAVLLWILIAYGLRYFFRRSPLLSFFYPTLLLKVVSGFALAALYYFYYEPSGSDTYLLFASVAKVNDYALDNLGTYIDFLFANPYRLSDFWYELLYYRNGRAIFFIKTLSLLNFITANSYLLAAMYLSLFSFSGLFALSHALVLFAHGKGKLSAIIAFLLMPTVVFWSSGLLKESLLMGSIGWACYAILRLLKAYEWHTVLIFLVSAYLVWKLKYYYFAALFPLLVSFVLSYRLSLLLPLRREAVLLASRLFLFGIILLLLLLPASYSHPNLHWQKLLHTIITNKNDMLAQSEPHNVWYSSNLEAKPQSFLQHAPKALFNGVFAPFWGSYNQPFKLLAALESITLLALLFIGLWQKAKFSLSYELLFALLVLCFYIAISATLIALATPNIGTLVRYKVGYFAFVVYLILLMWEGKLDRLLVLKYPPS